VIDYFFGLVVFLVSECDFGLIDFKWIWARGFDVKKTLKKSCESRHCTGAGVMFWSFFSSLSGDYGV
jgi:hypothetical protein